MGLTRDDVLQQKLPIPPDNYLAASREEELVMFAELIALNVRLRIGPADSGSITAGTFMIRDGV